MSLEVYEQARKIGLRCVKTRAAEGLDPYLPALEDEKLKILKTQELPVTAIPGLKCHSPGPRHRHTHTRPDQFLCGGFHAPARARERVRRKMDTSL